ncbi:MAG: RsmB/NOP family class I SAM-dependent RNA methyltransferase [Candidatus Hodarchaeales archaeon]|jgi:16S rRNA (cytosine967-C5)-methyltransferase
MANKKDRLTSAQLTIRILEQLQKPNQSLRLALAQARQTHQSGNSRVWGEVYKWVMEINKRQKTIDHIEQSVLSKSEIIDNQIKPFIDLATYWRFWGRRSITKIVPAITKLLRDEKKKKPPMLKDYLEAIEKTSLTESLEQISLKDERWSLQHSLPVLLYNKLLQFYTSEELEALGNWFNRPAPRYFWVNTLREATEEILKKIPRIKFIPVQNVTDCFRLKKGRSLQLTSVYSEGKVLIQDVAATIVTQLLPLSPNRRVLDVCAAPGNKSIQLLAREPSIELHVGDLPGSRYSLLVQRLIYLTGSPQQQAEKDESLTIEIPAVQARIHVNAWDARNLPCPNRSVDVVFIDAPCTGTGTLGTNPDLRKLINLSFVNKHVKLQEEILHEAERVVKQGGYILYVTCSLLPEENEEVISRFLNHNMGKKWQVEPINHPLAEKSPLLDRSLRFFPPRSRSEGFFVCLLKSDKS